MGVEEKGRGKEKLAYFKGLERDAGNFDPGENSRLSSVLSN